MKKIILSLVLNVKINLNFREVIYHNLIYLIGAIELNLKDDNFNKLTYE